MSSTNIICVYVPCCPVIADTTTNSSFSSIWCTHHGGCESHTMDWVDPRKNKSLITIQFGINGFLIACMCTLVQQPTSLSKENKFGWIAIQIYAYITKVLNRNLKIIYYFGKNHDYKGLCEEKVPKKPFATNTSSATAAQGQWEYLLSGVRNFLPYSGKRKLVNHSWIFLPKYIYITEEL